MANNTDNIIPLVRPEAIAALMNERKTIEEDIARLSQEYHLAAEAFYARIQSIGVLQKQALEKQATLDEAIFKLLYKKIDEVM